METFFQKAKHLFERGTLKKLVIAHKIASAIAAVVILGGGYAAYAALTGTSGETRYVLGTATTGTIVSTVSASGAVSASDQIDIKPKASGDVVWVGVKAGDTVYAGQALMSLDSRTAKQTVADAEASLEQSQLQYQKDQAQAPIDYQNALDSLKTATDNLATEYTNTFNTFSNAYLDLPAVVAGAQDVLFGYDLSPNGSSRNADSMTNMFMNDDRAAIQPFADKARSDYAKAKTEYDASLLAYQELTRSSSTAAIEDLLAQTINTTTDVSQVLQSELNFLGKVGDLATKNNMKVPSAVTAMQTTTRNYLATTNSDLNALLAEKKTLDNDKQAIKTDQQSITLLQVGNTDGSNPLNLQISKSSLDKQAQALQNAKDNLANYTVFAPFTGTIASVSAHVGDTAGASVATIVSANDMATLSLNEVDVSKLALGDKATLTFDAIDGLSLTGTVAEIDTVGTVSQGVVAYTVKIAFTAQDARVKPGMTVNAAIQTAVKQNVLTVPASAVKTQGGQSYVLVFTPPLTDTGGTAGTPSSATPAQVPVETGLSDDTNVEITSGLTEGEQIVVRSIAGTAAASATTAARTTTSTRGGFGGAGALGGAVRGL